MAWTSSRRGAGCTSAAFAIALAFAVGIGASRPAAGLTIQSTFDSGLEGWTAFGITVSWQSSGGNPGGYLLGDDQPNASYLIAPAAFLGDLSAFDGGQLSFDQIAIDLDNMPITGAGGEVTIFSGAQSATADLLTPLLTWQTGSVPLTAAAWGVSQATWTGILANVTGIQIVIDSTLGVGTDGFDNFTMVTPEPATALLIGGGIAGMAQHRRRRAVQHAAAPDGRASAASHHSA